MKQEDLVKNARNFAGIDDVNLEEENLVAEPTVKTAPAKSKDKLQHTIAVDKVDRTDVVEEYQLKYTVDSSLSNPMNKRFQEGWEGMTILEVFEEMTSNLGEDSMVSFSNGTRTVELSVQDWKEYYGDMLALFDCNDKSPDQNVWIDVRGKSVVKEDVQLSKL